MYGKQGRFRRIFLGLATAMLVSLAITLASCSSGATPAQTNSATPGSSASQTSETGTSAEQRAANERTAVEFARAFYDDWDFQDGNATYSTEAFNRRSLPYIAEGTALHDELSKDNSFGMGSTSRFIRTAALHAVEVKPEMRADDVCVVEVSYCGTQNTVTQEWYDNMMQRLNTATWTLAFDKNGKISSMEKGDVADKYSHGGNQGDNGAVNATASNRLDLNRLVTDEPAKVAEYLKGYHYISRETVETYFKYTQPITASPDMEELFKTMFETVLSRDLAGWEKLKVDISEQTPWYLELREADWGRIYKEEVVKGDNPAIAEYHAFRPTENPGPEDIAKIASEVTTYDKIVVVKKEQGGIEGYAETDDVIIEIGTELTVGDYYYIVRVAAYSKAEIPEPLLGSINWHLETLYENPSQDGSVEYDVVEYYRK